MSYSLSSAFRLLLWRYALYSLDQARGFEWVNIVILVVVVFTGTFYQIATRLPFIESLSSLPLNPKFREIEIMHEVLSSLFVLFIIPLTYSASTRVELCGLLLIYFISPQVEM